MAKLSARGRREWVRARRVEKAARGVVERMRVYMSDGATLVKWRTPGGPWHGWRREGKWNIVKPLPELRRELHVLGWEVCDTAQKAGAR